MIIILMRVEDLDQNMKIISNFKLPKIIDIQINFEVDLALLKQINSKLDHFHKYIFELLNDSYCKILRDSKEDKEVFLIQDSLGTAYLNYYNDNLNKITIINKIIKNE